MAPPPASRAPPPPSPPPLDPDRLPCVAGRQTTYGPSLCEVCSAGQFDADGNFSSPCVLCKAGRYSAAEAVECVPCAAGRASGSSAAASCEQCAAGRYSDADGATECTGVCPTGTYSDSPAGAASSAAVNCVQCIAGQVDTDSDPSTLCESCMGGQYQMDASRTECVQCPAGQHQQQTAQVECVDCVAGQFQDTAGQTVCRLCPMGQVNTAPAQLSCTDCVAGRYQSILGEQQCIDCAAGTANPAAGQSTCTDCSAGQFQDVPRQYSCIDCYIGQYSTAGLPSCLGCPDGQFQATRGNWRCDTYDADLGCNDSYWSTLASALNPACCPDSSRECHAQPPTLCDMGCAVALFRMRHRCSARMLQMWDTDDGQQDGMNGVLDRLWQSCLHVPQEEAVAAAQCEHGSLLRPSCLEPSTPQCGSTQAGLPPNVELIQQASECPPDQLVDPCLSNPCLEGSTCNAVIAEEAYTCTCALGYDGGNCENNPDDCASSPCQHGAVCRDRIGHYTCSCNLGYAGPECEIVEAPGACRIHTEAAQQPAH